MSIVCNGHAWVEVGRDIPLVQINIGFLTDQIRVPASDTLDLGEGIHDLLLAVDIGVEETKNELEVRLLSRYKCCDSCQQIATLRQNLKVQASLRKTYT